MPLLSFLLRQRHVRPDTWIATQLHFNEKWIDMVTLTASGSLTAYELKLNHVTRVLEQAAANTLSCDRSYMVTASKPGATAELQASALSVGLLIVGNNGIQRRLLPKKQTPLPIVRRQLVNAIKAKGNQVADVSGL